MASKQQSLHHPRARPPGFRVLAQTGPLVVGVCSVETVVQDMQSVAGTFLAVGQASIKKTNKPNLLSAQVRILQFFKFKFIE